ncbi:hypothetical protein DQK91_06905 [Oceanidesulfovibrio marinus]|uniref:Uncharacterized protein n=1 Tax=Oceanidesulfovibrio marinus TaxID=370038 RepID=A0A6P1ZIE0_9BACT|nr:hypothetical protein DQK91_06905 [Oceanidesulfovibrio marinus]
MRIVVLTERMMPIQHAQLHIYHTEIFPKKKARRSARKHAALPLRRFGDAPPLLTVPVFDNIS